MQSKAKPNVVSDAINQQNEIHNPFLPYFINFKYTPKATAGTG